MAPRKASAGEDHPHPKGAFVTNDGEPFYRIRNYDLLPPSILSVAEEENKDLGPLFHTRWCNSRQFGWIRRPDGRTGDPNPPAFPLPKTRLVL